MKRNVSIRSTAPGKHPALWISAGAAVIVGFIACGSPTSPPPRTDVTRAALIDTGIAHFPVCAGCHNAQGVGSPGGPPLKHSDYVMAERLRPVRIMLLGLPNAIDTAHTIMVNGIEYSGEMPPIAHDLEMTDVQIAGILTYIRAVLNDSTSTNCNPDIRDEHDMATCTKIARDPLAVARDSVAVWEVKAVRDSLQEMGLLTP